MGFEVTREAVEDVVGRPVVVARRGGGAEPGGALQVVGEKSMQIGAGNAAVRRAGAVADAVVEAAKGRARAGPVVAPRCIS